MNPFLPITDAMLVSSLATFSKVASVCMGLVGAVFIARVVILSLLISGPEGYGSLIKELLVFFLALHLFPPVVKIVVSTSAALAESIAVVPIEREAGAFDELLASIRERAPLVALMWDLGDLSLLHIARAAYSVLLGLLCAIAPLIFFIHFLTGQGVGFGSLSLTIVTLAMWPVVWNVLGLLAAELWPSFSQTSLASVCYSIVISGLQMFSPLFCVLLVKNAAPAQAVRSIGAVGVISRFSFRK